MLHNIEQNTHPDEEDAAAGLARVPAKRGELWREVAQGPVTDGGGDCAIEPGIVSYLYAAQRERNMSETYAVSAA